jgi:predicted ATPase
MSVIESVHFSNFKVLRNATLPLSPFTVMVGPNGSGKSTALAALQLVVNPGAKEYANLRSLGVAADFVEIKINWAERVGGGDYRVRWSPGKIRADGSNVEPVNKQLSGLQIYTFAPEALAGRVALEPHPVLGATGVGLANVLDRMRDLQLERFEALNEELRRCLPEFDRILFDTPGTGQREFVLRTVGGHRIGAANLSHGTLFLFAMLTIAHSAQLHPIICIEEPDRGVHPRLLREVQDALYRMAYPEKFGEKRDPTQVIATTHSPYFVDLYRDHPEEVVIAHKRHGGGEFERLSDRPDLRDILGSGSLGEVWFSGILGGVPSEG